MITCQELADFIGLYIERELPPEELAEFNAHLACCPWCVAYLETYEETIRLGRQAFADLDAEVPDEVPEELVAAVLAARRKTRRET